MNSKAPKPNYSHVLLRAWELVSGSKTLLWLGSAIFVTSVALNLRWSFNQELESSYFPLAPFLFFVTIFLLVAFIWLKFTAITATYYAAFKIDKGFPVTLNEATQLAKLFLKRIISVWLTINISIFILFLVLSVPVMLLMNWQAFILGKIILLAAAIIFVPVLILASFIGKYAFFYIILGNLLVMDAMESAYQLFMKKLAPSILMGLIISTTYIFELFAFGFVLLVLFLFLGLPGLIFYLLFSKLGIVIISILAGVLFLLAVTFVGAFFEAYRHTAWMLFFQDIASLKLKKKSEADEKMGSLAPAQEGGSVHSK